jgi:hypothetical protein
MGVLQLPKLQPPRNRVKKTSAQEGIRSGALVAALKQQEKEREL